MQKTSLYLESLVTLLFSHRVNKVRRSLLYHDMWLIDTVQEMYQLLMTKWWYVFEWAFD